MGYESRIYIVNRNVLDFWNKENPLIFGEDIASFELCSVPYEFTDIFTKPIDFSLYVDEEETVEDKYGKHCNMARINTVVEALEKFEAEDHYRRYRPVISLLKGFDESEWDDLWVVHYGH